MVSRPLATWGQRFERAASSSLSPVPSALQRHLAVSPLRCSLDLEPELIRFWEVLKEGFQRIQYTLLLPHSPDLLPRAKYTGDFSYHPWKSVHSRYLGFTFQIWWGGDWTFPTIRDLLWNQHSRVNDLVRNLFLWAGPPVPLDYLYWLS